MMKKLTKNILAGLTGFALVLFPQLGLTDEDADSSSGGSACLLYTSPSPRDRTRSRMPSSA